MKNVVIFPVVALIIFAMNISSCTRCMCCGPIAGEMQCVKGTDTVSRYINSAFNGNLTDSINFYQNNGYTCTSSTMVYWDRDAIRICNTKDIKEMEAGGDGCVPFNHGNCNVY